MDLLKERETMIDFCPSCGGIVRIAGDVQLMNMHNRLCRCEQPGQPTQPPGPAAPLTEEQVRAIVREEVAKALADVKRELPQEMAKQVRSKTGVRSK
jgi:hypothetical protein